ncbi:MAG: serine/threonine protein kinase [Lachnospiraceae bacterium]|nr:serine/threonine protein kinase [Lachnospiraceae bacterium]MDE6253203.1 serine/threonine protein kinase [Lachnospiraceae bacterium]
MNVSIYDIALKKNTIINYRYTINDYISFGNTTILYLAEDRDTKRQVLVKELYPLKLVNRDLDGKRLVIKNDLEDEFYKIREGFANEIKIVKKLTCGEIGLQGRVTEYVNEFAENDTLYLVTDYFEGFDLKQRIEKGECLNFRKISYELADIVQRVHNQGILHRDIKLSNVFIKTDGTVALLDFGSACIISEEKQLIKYASNGYSAPEMYKKEDSTLYADIYSIGAVMYKMLTGVIPLRADLRKDKEIKDITEYVNIPWPLALWIMRALELNPKKRIKSLSILKFLL